MQHRPEPPRITNEAPSGRPAIVRDPRALAQAVADVDRAQSISDQRRYGVRGRPGSMRRHDER